MENNRLANLYLVCEGESDKHILAALIHRVLRAEHSNVIVKILAAGGKQSIPRLVRALERQIPRGAALGMVVDSDGDPEGTKAFLSRDLNLEQYVVLIAHPTLQFWIESASNAISEVKDPKQIQTLIDQIDLDRIAHEHPEFGQLMEMVTKIGPRPIGVSSETSPKHIRTKTYSKR